MEAAIAAHPLLGNDAAIKLYNGGNFTDPTSIPPTDWPAITKLCEPFARVIVENHATMCGDRLRQFRDLLSPQLEVAIGLETVNADVLARQQKRMTLDDFARAADFLHRHAIAMRCFVLLQLPYADPLRCVADAVDAVLHAVDAGAVFVAIIPTRSHTEQMQKLIIRGEFVPPTLEQLETALSESLDRLRHHRKTSVVTADTWNIAAVAHCQNCQADRIANIDRMNRSQHPLPCVACEFCGHNRERA
jgi:radical SAM enzyme (TIGR01210 family)